MRGIGEADKNQASKKGCNTDKTLSYPGRTMLIFWTAEL